MNPVSPPHAAGPLQPASNIPAASGGLYVSKFLRSLRRRMIIVRAAEAAGIGLLVAAAVAFVLALLLLISGRDATQLCAAALATGACVGAAWSLLRPPTLLGAAIETDRQMNLADLLATALSRQDMTDPWQAAVIAMADQRCAALSPSDVILARLGARAWSGIGLSAALVLALGALSTSPRDSRATPGGLSDASINDPNVPPQSPTTMLSPHALPPVDVQSPTDESQYSTPEMVDDSAAGKTAAASSAVRQGSSSIAGESTSKTPIASIPAIGAALSPRTPTASRNTHAAGGGPTGDAASGTDQVSSRSAGPSNSTKPSPPWKAVTWPHDRETAGRALQKMPAADSYRDIVEQYFQPE